MPGRRRLLSAPHRSLGEYLGSWHTGSSRSLWLLAQHLPSLFCPLPFGISHALHPQFPAAQLPESNLFYQVCKHPLWFHFLYCRESNPFKLWACQASAVPQSYISNPFKQYSLLFLHLFSVQCVCVCMPQCLHTGRPEDNVQGSVFSVYHVGSGEETQVGRFGGTRSDSSSLLLAPSKTIFKL